MTLKQAGGLMEKAGAEVVAETVFKAFALFRGNDAPEAEGGAAPLEGQP
jgi:hypothetical protein